MKKSYIIFGIALVLALIVGLQISKAAIKDDTKGKILLQVEQNGEAWYINPDSLTRFYLGRPNDAFNLMKNLGLGIKKDELTNYLNSSFPQRLSGKILLNVEQNGEAYYIFPDDLKGYYLGKPSDAFDVMRKKGLGISDKDLAQIPLDTNSASPSLIINTEQQDLSQKTNSTDNQTIDEYIANYDLTNDNVTYRYDDTYYYVTSNGLANHSTGNFPNQGNPNTISEQNYEYQFVRFPSKKSFSTDVRIFGMSIGGVKMEPGTAERDEATGWSIEAIQDMLDLGLDFNNAHVQPNGSYHYHGVPESIVAQNEQEHSILIGFAADGFPIYARYGYLSKESSEIKKLESSWQLKQGQRQNGEPTGSYDGTYTNDFEFIQGSGDLDKCNGIETKTPEYPNGIYAYFLTDSFPYIPRCVMGTPHSSFEATNQGQGGQPNQIPPSGGRPPRF